MRITSFEKYDLSQMRLQKLQQYSNKLQVQLTTGKEYQKISQSPVKANASMLVSSGIKRIEQFQSNLGDLKAYVQTAESYLGMAVNDYQRGMELAIQSANGIYNDQDKQSFVLELNNLIEHMVGLGNSKHLDKYLFSGQATDTKALTFDGTSVVYNGSADVNKIRITSNMEIGVSVTAQDSLMPTIEGLIALRDALATGTAGDVGTAMENLQNAGESLLNARSQMGVRMTTVDMVSSAYSQNKLELQSRKTEVEDVDMADAIMKYTNAQNLYQGTIAATLKMYESSLLNYM